MKNMSEPTEELPIVLASMAREDNWVVEDENRKRLREKSGAVPLELVFVMGENQQERIIRVVSRGVVVTLVREQSLVSTKGPRISELLGLRLS
jgi:hypothetical protein